MKLCQLNELSEQLFGIDYHYSLINFNNIPIEETVRFSSRRGERPWSRIMLITEGEAEISYSGGTFTAMQGECVSIPRDSEFNLEWKSGGAEGKVLTYVIAFTLYDRFGEELILSELPTLIKNCSGDQIKAIFAESVREYSANAGDAKLRCKALLLNLLGEISNRRRDSAYAIDSDASTISPAVRYIEESYMTDIDIPFLLMLCHTSESTLRRTFIHEKGVSPMAYLNNTRMSHAYDLLMQGIYSVSEVAARVNIPDVSYFSRRFKAAFGVSPGRIKRG